jgi:hypothetical protein
VLAGCGGIDSTGEDMLRYLKANWYIIPRSEVRACLSPEVVLWDNATQAIHVGAELSQEQHATIMHIFGYHVVAARLRRTLAWLGGITEKPA